MPVFGGFPELGEMVHLRLGVAARCQRKFCGGGGKVKGSVAKAPFFLGCLWENMWACDVKGEAWLATLPGLWCSAGGEEPSVRRGLGLYMVLWHGDMPGPWHRSGRKHGHNRTGTYLSPGPQTALGCLK